MNRKQELQALADKIASFTPLGGPISLIARERRMIENALRLAAQADAPAILPQQMREALESARDYIASVNFYAAGTSAYIKTCEQLIKIDAALAHTRPECGSTK